MARGGKGARYEVNGKILILLDLDERRCIALQNGS